jgi:hypothetical protein
MADPSSITVSGLGLIGTVVNASKKLKRITDSFQKIPDEITSLFDEVCRLRDVLIIVYNDADIREESISAPLLGNTHYFVNSTLNEINS